MTNSKGLIITLLLLSIVTHGVISQCTDGCLKCDVIDENSSLCEICDVFGYYVPFGNGLCIKVEVENCEIPSAERSESKCLKCKDGFIYDTTTRKCKEVAHPIENCKAYGINAECLLCKENYKISENKCVAIETPIANCEVYTESDPITCAKCNAGYYMNLKDNTCTQLPSDSDCLMYTRKQCLECNPGYLLNQNYSLKQKISSDILKELLLADHFNKNNTTNMSFLPISNCQKTLVADCASYESFEVCKVCNTGFFLAEEGKACIKYPENPIPLCQDYINNVTCSKCVNGAYKDGVTKCLESSIVEFCIEYSQTENKCNECEYGYYLNNGTCKSRVDTLKSNQCDVLNKEADLCSSCNPGFILNSSGTGCLGLPSNCKNGQLNGSGEAVCSECQTGYGLSNNNCVLKTDENCNGYDGNKITCLVCKPNYYIDSTNNICRELTVSNCLIPSSTSDTCTTCNDYFFLNSDNLCELRNKANCLVFETNTNNCTTCQVGYWLDSSDSSCKKRTITNCEVAPTDADSCTTCDTGYYPKSITSSSNFECVLQEMTGCKNFTVNTNECIECTFPGYWKDGTTCVAHTLANCDEFSTTSASCVTCSDNYFLITLSQDGTVGECKLHSESGLTNCVKYKVNEKVCLECANLFQLVSDACQSITATNCNKSELNNDVCLECNTGFTLTNATTCTARSTVTTVIDPLCGGNNNSVDDGTCTVCTNINQMAFKITAFEFDNSGNLNCKIFDPTNGNCKVCKSGFVSDSNSICNVPLDPSTQFCKLRKDDATQLQYQTNHSECKECIPKYYVDTASSNTCTKRGASALNCDLNGLNLTADTCNFCSENSFYGSMDGIATCTNNYYDDTYSGATCLSYNATDLTKCAVCDALTSGDDCSGTAPANGSFINAFNNFMKLIDKLDVTTEQTNCDSNRFSIDKSYNAICSSCSGTTRALISSDASTIFGTTFDETNVTSPFADIPAFVGGCSLKTDSLAMMKEPVPLSDPTEYRELFASSDNAVDDFSYLYNGPNGVIGLGCKGDKVPTFAEGSHKSDDSPVTSDYKITVSSCADDTDYAAIKKRYKGMSYGYNSEGVLALEYLIYKDSCVHDNQMFVVFFDVLTTGNSSLKLKNVTGGNAFCINKDLDDFSDVHTPTANCQIHLDTSDTPSDYETSVKSPTCISCKPGYYGDRGAASSPVISQCSPIENCNTSQENFNTWMNACETCNSGYAWTYDPDNSQKNFIKYHMCVATTVTNCKIVYEDSPNECAFCKDGYTTTDAKQCVKMEIDGCTEYTMGRVNVGTTEITDSLHKQTLTIAAHYLYDLKTRTNGIGCKVCGETGYKKIEVPSNTTDAKCIGSISFNYDTKVANCKYHATTAGQCAECNEGFVVDTSNSNVCVQNTTFGANCKKIASSACSECFVGEIVSSACPLYNKCKTIADDGSLCKVCEEGYKIGATVTECVEITEDVPCLQFGEKNVCYKCKDDAKSPITYLNSSGVGYRSECVDKYDHATVAVENTVANAVYVINTNPIDTVFGDIFYNTAINTESNLIFTDFSFSGTVSPRSVCLNKPVTEFCEEGKYDKYGLCIECVAGYIKDSVTSKCKEGHILNCIEYDNANTLCVTCSDDFYSANSQTSCEVRLNKTCSEYEKLKDECISCEKGMYKENGICYQHTVEFCETYNTDANACLTCALGQRYKDGDICSPYTVSACKTFSTTADECVDCNTNRYKSATTKDCELYTVANCNEYELELNECKTCKTGFYLSSSKNCLLPQAEHCQDRDPSIDKCTSCVNGYYLENATTGVCLLNSSENCETKSITANECTSCSANHYLNPSDKKCLPHTADFCKTYKSDTDQCDECMTGYYKDNDNICKLNTSAFCSVKSITLNECEICLEKYYLVSNQCIEVTNFTCENIKENTNECETCRAGYYLDSNTKTCMKLKEVSNCNTYENDEDKCKKCNSGYYLSSNKDACYPNPNGILNCVGYQDSSTCIQCSSTTYLENNKCLDLTEAAITDCIAYSANGICSLCATNKFLNSTENNCENATASGCVTWADKENCATCLANQLLDGTPKLCVNTTIGNCAVVSGTVGNETCALCEPNYFLSENNCTLSETLITDCIKYSDNGICELCQGTKVTSNDGKSCENLNKDEFGLHCAVGTSTGSPVCAICKDGKVLGDDGKCSVSCESSNCMICNPLDLKQCLMCATGYHMTDTLECKVNGSSEDGTDNSVNLIKSSLILLLLSILLLKND